MPKVSILHISDLHKIPGTQYESLVQSLLDDRYRYSINEHIKSPNYIVISGDLIQGGETIDEIRNQYTEVACFLTRLCGEYLNGDKSRLIMVPGNHDVSYPDSMSSMTREPDGKREENLKLFKTYSPEIRWNWKDFSFYKITDIRRYEERFHLFIEFYNKFYEGIRSFTTPPTKKAECITFPKDKIAFVLFNSCNRLDHLNDVGDIDEESISSVIPQLRENFSSGFLNIAVWHHHYYGTPRESNYLSKETVASMSHRYIKIGMFGHQHKSQVAEFIAGDLSFSEGQDNDKVLLISSGTLFGGARELPYGCKRQYNIIELDIQNGKVDVAIHVREDRNENVQSKIPYWGKKNINECGLISTQINLKQLDEDEQLSQLIRTVKNSGDYIYGVEYLIQHNLTGGIYDKLRLEFVRNIHDDDYILHRLVPQTEEEYLLVVSRVLDTKDEETRLKLLGDNKLEEMAQKDSLLGEYYQQLVH